MELAQRLSNKQGKDSEDQKKQLIAEHLPYVKRIVQRIAVHLPSSVELDDLINAGVIGLIEAVERYDSTRDNKFMTYAQFRIRGAVLSELRSRDYLSKSNRRKIRELERANLKLERELGREVRDDELAKELGLSLDEFYKIKKISSISFVSFDEIGYSSQNEKKSLIRYLINEDSEDALNLARLNEIENAVAEAIDQLGDKERLVVSLYYWDELTMKEIGKIMSITESRVSQLHAQAVNRLRRKLLSNKIIDD